MRLRHIPGCEQFVAESPSVVHDPMQYKGRWQEYFGNDHPVELEIGMGKGKFIRELSRRHPEINFLGLERYETVLMKAIKRKEQEELAEDAPRKNLGFLCVDANLLPEIFAPGEVAKIYLNFSDPWPKARHAKRRLTSRQFLARYEQVLKDGGRIEFKTDNNGLFEFSLEEIAACPNWELVASTRDLHHDLAMNEGNIMTEYERKFSALGNKINKLIAVYHKP